MIIEADKERILEEFNEKYHSLAIVMIIETINRFFECSLYKEMKKKKEIAIRAGEYMDSTILLYPKN